MSCFVYVLFLRYSYMLLISSSVGSCAKHIKGMHYTALAGCCINSVCQHTPFFWYALKNTGRSSVCAWHVHTWHVHMYTTDTRLLYQGTYLLSKCQSANNLCFVTSSFGGVVFVFVFVFVLFFFAWFFCQTNFARRFARKHERGKKRRIKTRCHLNPFRAQSPSEGKTL